MRRACWAAMVLCLLAAKADARNIYVDNLAGDDKNSGLHPRGVGDATGPVRTIAKALRLSQAGDRMVLSKKRATVPRIGILGGYSAQRRGAFISLHL